MHQFNEYLPKALEEGEPFALGILSSIKGSSPQRKGAKAIFFSDGRIYGTLGGGCLEAEIQDRARRALQSGRPASFELILDHDFGWDDGLICGGKVEGLILPRAAEAVEVWRRLMECKEPVCWGVRRDFSIVLDSGMDEGWLYRETAVLPWQLWIAGSGHIAQAVAPMAWESGFEVTVFDDRPALADRRHFAEAIRLRVGYWDRLLEEPMVGPPVCGLIVTRGHQHDARVLRNWIQRPFAFLGMIGSQRKKRIIFEKFLEDGLATEEQLNAVACPVGLDIGAVSVPEIAISIMAQLVQRRAQLAFRLESRDEAAGESVGRLS